jgi:hypothetical protein
MTEPRKKRTRPVKYHDAMHEGQRRYQLKYDRTIAAIRRKHKCSFKEAQQLLRKAKREAVEKLTKATGSDT